MSEGSGKTILVVDDSELLLELAEYQLTASGFSVVTTTDLAALPRLIEQQPPDLIILDVRMPGSTPSELIESLSGSGAPVWLFSALDETTLAERAAETGADGYVCKNDGIDTLARRARELLE